MISHSISRKHEFVNGTAAMSFAVVLFCMSCFVVCGCSRDTMAFRHYMQQYPEAQLQDVYKWCFQNVYGPGHLIADSAACAQNIMAELSEIRPDDTFPDYEPCGPDGKFVRVNLRLIRDSVIPLPIFVESLVASASMDNPMPLDLWRNQWSGYCTRLSTLHSRPLHFVADSVAIDSLLRSGNYVFHHSRHFNDCYAPHYRIIRQDLFESNLFPLLHHRTDD